MLRGLVVLLGRHFGTGCVILVPQQNIPQHPVKRVMNEEAFKKLEVRLKHLEDRLDGITKRLDGITKRVDGISELLRMGDPKQP
eukprot:g18058.t1